MYLNKMKSKFNRDPKSFYMFVNSKRKSSIYPSVMKYRNQESSDDKVISNMFAEFFSNTYSSDSYNIDMKYPYDIKSGNTIHFPTMDYNHVLQHLKKIKVSYNCGPDGVPSCILNRCAESLAMPLTHLFNTSIKYGYFPAFWRDSYIIPLYKSGNKSDITNYRGIAKLSAIPKLFEKIITENLCHQASSLLSVNQHGFRKGCSTSTNVLQLTSLINTSFIEKKQTDAVYTDFSKAFDKVNHDLLLHKLELIGFSNVCINWLKSYLTCRNQTVIFNNSKSKSIAVLSGVPQGSHLGPILFSLFINDLPNVIQFSNILMYADDVKIFNSFKYYADHVKLQNDLNNFFAWCRHNMMVLNLNKCKLIRFSRNTHISVDYFLGDYQLELVDSFLDLGILLDQKLTFVSHITMTVNKARGVLSFIKRWAKEFSDPYITKRLYTVLVSPILEYGSVVWDPYYNIHSQRIESVQKQFLLFCLRSLNWSNGVGFPSYARRLALIKLPTLESRRKMLNISFMLNLINGYICCDFILRNIRFNVPCRHTRNYKPLYVNICRTNYALADPLTRLCNDFNNLYHIIDFDSDVKIIKHKIILHLNSIL